MQKVKYDRASMGDDLWAFFQWYDYPPSMTDEQWELKMRLAAAAYTTLRSIDATPQELVDEYVDLSFLRN